MMQGYSLSANLPEDTGLGERFWYWRGVSGQSYIHSIYMRELCPSVPGAVFVIVRKSGGVREPVATGRFGPDGALPPLSCASAEEEIHIHLLARDAAAAERVLRDLESAMEPPAAAPAEPRVYRRPVQLELLAA